MRFVTCSLPLLAAWSCTLPAQSSDAQRDSRPEADGGVTLEGLFGRSDYSPARFGPARWLDDGAGYTTLEPAEEGEGRDVVLYDPATGKRSVLVSARALVPGSSSAALEIANYVWSKGRTKLLVFTNTRKVWRQNTRGDYWVLDLASGALGQLGADFEEATLMFAKFSPDGERVAYVQAGDLYVEDLDGGGVKRLTHDGSQTVTNGTFDWVYEEEFGLRDGFRWSPDGERIAYWRIDSEGVGVFHLIDNAAGPYPRLIPIRYPKVGTTNSECKVGVVPAAGGETLWIEPGGDAREQYLARMDWAENSNELVLQRLDRHQNTLDLLLADATTGSTRPILREEDQAWVDTVDDLTWLDGGRWFLWVSERDGWRHLYRVSRDGRESTCLTSGAYDVVSVVGTDAKEQWVYFIASPDEPTRRYLFRVPLERVGEAERLTPLDEPGTHAYQMSPDGRWAIHTHSAFESPAEVDLLALPKHDRVRRLEEDQRLRERYAALPRTPVEFFRIPIGDGVELDGWCMKPPGFTPTRSWPVLFYVYGEPWGQTVADRWGAERYLWHLMLTQRGYVVMSVDNRGTPSPRGRDWRKCVYGRIGELTSYEQAEAVRAIQRRWSWVDPERIGIWGWSGGGSSTLQALFRYPDLYHVGMSVAPVPDQRLYDTIYQERYTGLLDEHPERYADNSPIAHVDGLAGDLLLVHGTGDDNVHYQGAERLIDAMVAAKKSFTMMAYPMRSHSIQEGEGTRLHLFTLLTSYLEKHLKAGPR